MPTTDERRLLACLKEVYRGQVAVGGRFARNNLDIIAMAASMQLITTRIEKDVYGRAWQITLKGLRYINEQETK